MLTRLHVKNMAVIRDEEIEFGPGLNIITGETGAGKSVLLGSVGLALGQKAPKGLIRQGAEYALAELSFALGDKGSDGEILEKLAENDIYPEDGEIILSRKVTESRSTCRINGETVPSGILAETAALLIDIHGQEDNAVLLKRKNHRELLDAYGGVQTKEALLQVELAYRKWRNTRKELEEAMMDSVTREHTLAIIQHEVNEIEAAGIRPGEDEELEKEYNKLRNGQKITESCENARELLGGDEGALMSLGRSIRELSCITSVCEDEEIASILGALSDGEDIIEEASRNLERYLSHMDFSFERYGELEERLNVLNHLKSRYGGSLEDVLAYLEKQQEELTKLENYEDYLADLTRQTEENEKVLREKAEVLTGLRMDFAKTMEIQVESHLRELNFPSVQFKIVLVSSEDGEVGAQGAEEVEFRISLNPGEPVKPLAMVASGGERSRIMLAIKTVLSDKDQIPTLIFDEIDTGISGRTAQMVAEKMREISGSRQVLSVTHLAQIAAMADHHFVIRKDLEEDSVSTHINEVCGEDSVMELARILGGTKITQAVVDNAAEMKEMAKR